VDRRPGTRRPEAASGSHESEAEPGHLRPACFWLFFLVTTRNELSVTPETAGDCFPFGDYLLFPFTERKSCEAVRAMATFSRSSKESISKSTTAQSRERPSRPRLPPRINLSRTKSAVELVESSSDRNEKQVNWGDHQELFITDGPGISRPHTARNFLLGRPSSSGSKKNLMTAAGSRKNLLASPGSRKSLHSESAKNLITDTGFNQYLAFLKTCIHWHDLSEDLISFLLLAS
jgi:hypothetical protein